MYKSTFFLVALSILASLKTYSATPKPNELVRRTIDWNRMSQSLTRRSTIANLQLSEAPTCAKDGNATIKAADCYSGLRDYLVKKDDGNWIVQIRSTNVKSCGSCKVRLRTTDDGEILVPLVAVEFGVDLKGGLNLLLNTCGGLPGGMLLPFGSTTGGKLQLTVDYGSGAMSCAV